MDIEHRGERARSYLEKCRCGIPFLFRSSVPRIENTQTDLSVVVEIRIESNSVISCCFQVNRWWRRGILVGKVNVEEEASVGVGRAVRSGDQHSHHIHSVFIPTSEDRRTERQRQRSGDGDLFLR